MEERESEKILDEAIKALNNEQIPPGPPEELAHATLAKLTEDSGQTNNVSGSRKIRLIEILRVPSHFTKVAAAAVFLIMAGYATGRLLSPKPLDVEQIRAALEPEIRKNVLGQVDQYLQSSLTASFTQFREQYQRDMSQFATYTIAASGATTNQRLEQLIEAINQAQTKDRQWFAAALSEIELNQLEGDAQLSNALTTFAARTEQNMAQLMSLNRPDSQLLDESKN